MTKIHSSAYIAEQAELAANVEVGPFAVIEAGAKIGEGCRIGAHSVIHGAVQMGPDNVIHAHVVLGDLPQDLTFDPATPSFLSIGRGNVFREGFTAHRASRVDQATVIGDQGYFMNYSHVAHDCRIGDLVIFANNVALAGHVEVGSRVFLGGAVVVHQFCRIGAYAIVQGTTGINQDVLPFSMIGGRPARHYRLNRVGLKRAGIEGERYRVLEQAMRRLQHKQSLADLPETEELAVLTAWLKKVGKRGIHDFIVSGKSASQEPVRE